MLKQANLLNRLLLGSSVAKCFTGNAFYLQDNRFKVNLSVFKWNGLATAFIVLIQLFHLKTTWVESKSTSLKNMKLACILGIFLASAFAYVSLFCCLMYKAQEMFSLFINTACKFEEMYKWELTNAMENPKTKRKLDITKTMDFCARVVSNKITSKIFTIGAMLMPTQPINLLSMPPGAYLLDLIGCLNLGKNSFWIIETALALVVNAVVWHSFVKNAALIVNQIVICSVSLLGYQSILHR